MGEKNPMAALCVPEQHMEEKASADGGMDK